MYVHLEADPHFYSGWEFDGVNAAEFATETGGQEAVDVFYGSGAYRKTHSDAGTGGTYSETGTLSLSSTLFTIYFLIAADVFNASDKDVIVARIYEGANLQRQLSVVSDGAADMEWKLLDDGDNELASSGLFKRHLQLDEPLIVVWQIEASNGSSVEQHTIDVFDSTSIGFTLNNDEPYQARTPLEHRRISYTAETDLTTPTKVRLQPVILDPSKNTVTFVYDDAVVIPNPIARLGVVWAKNSGTTADDDWTGNPEAVNKWKNVNTVAAGQNTSGADGDVQVADTLDGNTNLDENNDAITWDVPTGDAPFDDEPFPSHQRIFECLGLRIRYQMTSSDDQILPLARLTGGNDQTDAALPDSAAIISNNNFWLHRQTPEDVPADWSREAYDKVEVGVEADGAGADTRLVKAVGAMMLFQHPYTADCGFM